MWHSWIQKYQSLLDRIFIGATVTFVLWVMFIFNKRKKAMHAEIERTKIIQEKEAAEKQRRDEELNELDVAIAEKHKVAEAKIAAQKRLREIDQRHNDLKIAAEKLAAQEAEAKKAADKKIVEDILNAFKIPPHKK
jgi:uncharacterized oligopeptide transporter (OPT) family protein